MTSLCIHFVNYVFTRFPSMQLLHWGVNYAKPSSVPLTSYEMELKKHVHVQVEKQMGFHEHQIS